MKFPRLWTITTSVLLIGSSIVYATPSGSSISINFGADQPNGAPRSDVTGAAGVAGTVNWNNLDGPSGGPAGLVMDVQGATMPSSATISWTSNNVWASTGNGEENNTAPAGNDRALMTGYLDTTDVSVTEITVTGLDDVFTSMGYRVAVYIQGGVNGRGGQYTLQSENKISSLNLVQGGAFNGTYVAGGDAGANYLVFSDFTDSDFTLTATPEVGAPPRAPINGIEIVAIPEPSAIILLALGIVGLIELGRRVRRQ